MCYVRGLTWEQGLEDPALMLKQTLDTPQETRWVSEQGELIIRRPTPLVVVFVEIGHLEAEFADRITEGMTKSLSSRGKPRLFVDGEHLDGYDPLVRTQATKWIQQNGSRIQEQHMLVKSRIAKMGLSVASLMLGAVIIGHHERHSFERALRDAVEATSSAFA